MITILIQGRFLKKSQPLRDGARADIPRNPSRSDGILWATATATGCTSTAILKVALGEKSPFFETPRSSPPVSYTHLTLPTN